jgi:hypothetical protein
LDGDPRVTASIGSLARAWGDEDRPPSSLTVPRLRALHPAEDIGSALKAGVNVCQRQLVNEVFGPLVTKFVRNFGREGATLFSAAPMPAFSVASRPSNSSDIRRSDISEPPLGRLVVC